MSTRVSTEMSATQVRASQGTGLRFAGLRRQSSQGRRSRGAQRVGRRTLATRSDVGGHNGIGRPKGPAYSRFFAPFRPDCRGISTVGDVKEGPREQNDAF